jgi:hypothetical protein
MMLEGSREVKAARDATVKQCNDFLATHPEELENSIGIVARTLAEKHMAAALWLQKTHGMELDIHNLHNLIAYWDEARALGNTVGRLRGKGKEAGVLIGTPAIIDKGIFNPAHLIEYFASGLGQ